MAIKRYELYGSHVGVLEQESDCGPWVSAADAQAEIEKMQRDLDMCRDALSDAVRLIEHLGGNAGLQKLAIARSAGTTAAVVVATTPEMTSRELEFLEIVARQRDTMDKIIKRVERLESKSVMTEVSGF